jgi:hypothetical protein
MLRYLTCCVILFGTSVWIVSRDWNLSIFSLRTYKIALLNIISTFSEDTILKNKFIRKWFENHYIPVNEYIFRKERICVHGCLGVDLPNAYNLFFIRESDAFFFRIKHTELVKE